MKVIMFITTLALAIHSWDNINWKSFINAPGVLLLIKITNMV